MSENERFRTGMAVRCQFSDTFTRARVMDLDSLGLLGLGACYHYTLFDSD
jgi:hypothetical protein